MNSPTSIAPVRGSLGAAPGDAYAVSAEFYDVLQGESDAVRVRQLYGEAVRNARLGVLDIGAGTGRVTLLGLAESGVGVHAVEPSRAMRSALMTRLASLPRDLRERVTVHPKALGEFRLRGVADLAICHNTVACLDPASRRRLWLSVEEAVCPGGVFLLQLPPARLPRRRTIHMLPPQVLGRHEYGGRMVMSAEMDRIRARFDYWVRDVRDVRNGFGVLREHSESFWMWPASRDELAEEMAEYGLTPVRGLGDDAAVLAVRRR